MAKKKVNMAKIETKEQVSTEFPEPNGLTSEDIVDLKTDDDLLPLEGKEDNPPPTAIAGKSLSELNKEIKAKLKAEGKSMRVTSSENQKKYALSRTATALEKRGWEKKKDGTYELSGHKLSIDQDTLVADVDGYELPLGKDSLKILDQYMVLSQASAASSAQG